MFAGGAVFDWYQATVPASMEALRQTLLVELGDLVAREVDCPVIRPFKRGIRFLDGTSDTVCETYWGGVNPQPHVRATSDASPRIAAILRSRFPDHRVSRLDTCVDLRGPGLLDAARPVMARLRAEHRLAFEHRGPALEADRGEQGTTLYLGSASSPVRIRVYEKGLQLYAESGNRALLNFRDWVRFELQWRPQKHAKSRAATTTADEAWGVTTWAKDLAASMLGIDPDRFVTPRWREADLDRALRALAHQYGATLDALEARYGSPEAVFGAVRAIRTGDVPLAA